MAVPYLHEGLTLGAGQNNDMNLVLALQRDLRALGYLRSGMDGAYGPGTVLAVKALQVDLMHNDGTSHQNDGPAPVAIKDFNCGPTGAPLLSAVTGVVDQATAACIDRLQHDERVVKVPDADDPAQENRKAMAAISSFASTVAPTPFVTAIVMQESGGQHFRVPGRERDNFVVLGLDRGDPAAPDRITSRGYGIGQFTLFHHPPRADEIAALVLDPVRNVQRTFSLLRQKFDRFVVGPDNRADERQVEHPLLPLRLCRYTASDPRYLRDCRNCAAAVRKVTISPGTPAYAGANFSYQPDQYYPSANYYGVPDRAEFLCDWPYAVRRYNGSGNDSFHYQTRVLLNLLNLPA